MSIKIYFDMDGVLADFEKSATKIVREIAPKASCYNYADLNRPSECLTPDQKEIKVQFWRSLAGTDFFKNLYVLSGANEMVKLAYEIVDENLFILSKAPSASNFEPGSDEQEIMAQQKIDWALDKFSDYFLPENVIIVKGGKKGDFIKPTKTDILIDDRHDNIENWESIGGSGILYTSAENVMKELNLYRN